MLDKVRALAAQPSKEKCALDLSDGCLVVERKNGDFLHPRSPSSSSSPLPPPLPAVLGALPGLTSLSCAGNQLTGLGPLFAAFVQAWTSRLEVLNLSRNDLGVLPPSIGGLGNLRVLDVSSNMLVDLPDAMKGLRHLVDLSLDGNLLESVPSSIHGLSKLEVLGLSSNKIHAMPLGLHSALPQLGVLRLEGNPCMPVLEHQMERE
uniref:Uncharacterized protein n=1 Tax=Octactis speculum TaxID=3111310 RepID=A0A7S2GMK2_9STRA